jgi:hypothetical protein
MLHVVGVRRCDAQCTEMKSKGVQFPVNLSDDNQLGPAMQPKLNWRDQSRLDWNFSGALDDIRQIYAMTKGEYVGDHSIVDVSWAVFGTEPFTFLGDWDERRNASQSALPAQLEFGKCISYSTLPIVHGVVSSPNPRILVTNLYFSVIYADQIRPILVAIVISQFQQPPPTPAFHRQQQRQDVNQRQPGVQQR